MKRREFIALIGVSAAWPAVAPAQQQPTLGLLSSSEMADWAIKLRAAGILDSERRGLWAYYYVVPGALEELSAWLS